MNLSFFSLSDVAGPAEFCFRSTARFSPARRIFVLRFAQDEALSGNEGASLGSRLSLLEEIKNEAILARFKPPTCCSNQASPPANYTRSKIAGFILKNITVPISNLFLYQE
jgi:hypothetical protein